MRVFKLVLALALGASTVATAQPQSPQHHGDRDRDRAGAQWISLSGSIPANRNRHVIQVDAGAGLFEKVQVTIDSGWVFVKQIAIEVGPNRWQRYRFNRAVRVGGTIEVALPGGARAISRVVVQIRPKLGRGNGSFSVLALRAAERRHHHDRDDRGDWYDRYDP